MARPKGKDCLLEIRELKEKGFIRSSKRLLYYVRTECDLDIKIFRTGVTTGSGRKGKYSSIDIFGERHNYCYDIDRKKEFIDFLVTKFLAKNGNADMNIRKVFSRLLHTHGLHWEGCYCRNKNGEDKAELLDRLHEKR